MAADRHIPSLDGLRGFSITLVVLAHLQGVRGVPAFLSTSVFDRGQLGVRFFFVVSGFLITRLIADEIESTGWLSIKLFYIRRVLRIFPAFYAYLAVVALASALHWLDIPLHNLAFAATYTTNYLLDGRWETGHLWSLAIEEQFYLIWPITIVTVGMRRAVAGAAALMALAPYALLALFLHGAGPYLLATQTFPFAFDALAAGCVLGGALPSLLASPVFASAIASPYGELVGALVNRPRRRQSPLCALSRGCPAGHHARHRLCGGPLHPDRRLARRPCAGVASARLGGKTQLLALSLAAALPQPLSRDAAADVPHQPRLRDGVCERVVYVDRASAEPAARAIPSGGYRASDGYFGFSGGVQNLM
jgi:hypothetical protein